MKITVTVPQHLIGIYIVYNVYNFKINWHKQEKDICLPNEECTHCH